MLTAAFATADGVHVDAHFGRCARFDIYDIAADSVVMREVRSVASVANDEADSGDDQVRARLDVLAGCALVCVASIGPGAAAQVVKARVHPLKTAPSTTIASVLDRLQVVLQGTPPPWLRKLQHPSPTGGSQ
jgi:nitrogen fixation protein NifX